MVSCDSSAGRAAFKRALDERKDFKTSEPPMRRPLVRLIGVSKDLSDARVLEALRAQNKNLTDGLEHEELEMRVVRRTRGRTSIMHNIIVELGPKIWQRLCDQRVRVGYQVVNVVDQSPVVQCFKCMGYGHTARICRAEERCGHCGGAHETRSCPPASKSAPPSCCHCKGNAGGDAAHPAYWDICPERQRWDRIARQSVQYC
ncbi:unnamed protein product [Plutella xylostella]|uniref:(diamondback moth) hypothetical protein n=1 Tax=Plutella xylostella TaxID=51655 RepID=A0A8S4GFA1_PLUXY|nr:unnamed protein product [Plutella xylostella]